MIGTYSKRPEDIGKVCILTFYLPIAKKRTCITYHSATTDVLSLSRLRGYSAVDVLRLTTTDYLNLVSGCLDKKIRLLINCTPIASQHRLHHRESPQVSIEMRDNLLVLVDAIMRLCLYLHLLTYIYIPGYM